MHTRSSSGFARHSATETSLPDLAKVVLLALLPLSVATTTPASAQPEFPGAPSEPGVNLRVYPLDTWSPRVGIGAGAGLVVHHLGRSNALGLLTLGPARYEQVAAAVWASANPRRARTYVLLNARGVHTDRDWFYGLGPASPDDGRQSIERSGFEIRLRAGRAFLDRRLVVQPHIALAAHRVDRVPIPSDPALDGRSRTHLQQLASNRVGPLDPNQTGLRVGVGAEYEPSGSQRGEPGVRLQARWSRYVDVSSSFVRFDQVEFGAYPSVPLGGHHHLVGRLDLSLTRSRGRASVPFYMRPTLEAAVVPGWPRHRFVDSDRLMASLLYRFPVARIFGIVDLDAHLGVHASNVYDDFFSDAAFDVSFDETLPPSDDSVPLRPSASAGFRLGLPFREVPSLEVAVGASPEGISVARLTLSQTLGALRLGPHHLIRRR